MPLDQAVLDHRVIGGVAARRRRAAADRRDRRRRPPRHDRRLAEAAARRRPGTGRSRPLRLRHDPRARRASGAADRAGPEQAHAGAVLFCNVGDVTNLAVAKGRSCLFTRVSPVGLDDMAASLASSRRPRPASTRGCGSSTSASSQPLEQIEGDPAMVAEARAALEHRRRRPARRAAPLARLLRRPGGARSRSSAIVLCGPGSAIAGPRRADGAGARPADRDRPAPKRSPASTPPPPPASPSPTASPWRTVAMRPVNLIPERGTSRRAASRCAAARSPTSSSAPSSPPCSGSRPLVLDRQPDLRPQGRNRPDRRRRSPRPKRGPRQLAAYTQFHQRQRTAGRDHHQPRRQPLRLGAGDARTGPGPARRRLAHQPDRHRQPRGGAPRAQPASRCARRSPARPWS